MKFSPYLRFTIGVMVLFGLMAYGYQRAMHDPSVYYGKDNGLVFVIALSCLGSSLLWCISLLRAVHLITGFAVGVASYLLVFVLFGLLLNMAISDVAIHVLAGLVSSGICLIVVRRRLAPRKVE